MFSKKGWLTAGCVGFVFFGALGAIVYLTEAKPQTRSQSSKKNESSRLLETSFITSKTDRVEDEPFHW